MSGRGRVALTPELETALARRLVEETAPLAEAGKLGAYLVQLTPAFSPAKHSLGELDGLIDDAEAAPRGASSCATATGCATSGATTPCAGSPTTRSPSWRSTRHPDEHFSIMPSDFDAVTTDDLAFIRLHGRNTDGYLKGKSVAERFAWRYEDDELEEIAGRARSLAEQAGEVHVAFNNNRGDDAPDGGAALPRPAGPGARR